DPIGAFDRRRCRDADLLPDLQPVRVHPRVDVDDRLYSSVKAVGKAEEGIAGLDRVEKASRAETRPWNWSGNADLLPDLQPVRIHVGVGGNQGVNGDPETPGNTEEGIAGPDCIEKASRALSGRGRDRDTDLLADLEVV